MAGAACWSSEGSFVLQQQTPYILDLARRLNLDQLYHAASLSFVWLSNQNQRMCLLGDFAECLRGD